MRTAESVTLTCWPPAPLDRYVSMRRSFSSISMSTSSGSSGQTYTRRERRVAPRRLIERRDAHEPMDAGFGRQQAVGVLAGDRERRALQARFVARLVVDHLALEPAALGPAQVHAQQHLGPVLRLGAAGARMNRDDRVLAIVLAAEHLLDLAGLHFLGRARRAPARTRRRPPRPPRPTRRARRDRRCCFFSDSDEIAVLLQPAAALQDLLGFGLVFPEIGRGGARFEAGQFFVRACGFKDSSAGRPRVC